MVKTIQATTAAAAAAAFMFWLPAQAQTQKFTVDCQRGQTIASALMQGDSRKPLFLTIRGVCNENVVVDRDDVTLIGESGLIQGTTAGDTLTVRARRVQIDTLAIRGGSSGIVLVGASNVTINKTDIDGALRHGLVLLASSSVIITASNVRNSGLSGMSFEQSSATIGNGNEITANATHGLRIWRHSSVTIQSSLIADNALFGVFLANGSDITLTGATISGNGTNPSTSTNFKGGIQVNSSTAQVNNSNITNNLGRGVVVSGGGSITTGNMNVTGSAADGVVLYLGATAGLNGGTISGNAGSGIWLGVDSRAQVVGNTTILNNGKHGIEISQASKLWTYAPGIKIGSNGWFGLVCNDAESSAADLAAISFSPPNGWGDASCTGY